MNITRRGLMATIPAIVLIGCSAEQKESALVKIKDISASVTARIVGWFDDIDLASKFIEEIKASDARIQAAGTIGDVLREAVRNLSKALDGLLSVASLAPIPSSVIVALKTVNGALRAFLGIAGAAPGERQPSLDEAALAAASVPVRVRAPRAR